MKNLIKLDAVFRQKMTYNAVYKGHRLPTKWNDKKRIFINFTRLDDGSTISL